MLAGMGQIYLVRHGQASFNADDYDQLSPLGAQQARRLGDWFARCGRRVDAVHLGTLRRHRQTAEHFIETLRADLRAPAEPAVDAGFDEYDHEAILLAARPGFAGPADLRAWTARQAHPRRAFQQLFAEAMLRWVSGRHDADYAESWVGFRTRCMAALQGCIERAGASKTLVVVTSGGPISAICQALMELSDRGACELCFNLANSGVTQLLHGAGRISVAQLNSLAHLEAAGDPALLSWR
jgi:broad specificity phosphatase PhoE